MSNPITHGGVIKPAKLYGGTTNLVNNAREFAESGDSYTGPEVRLWVYNLCDEIDRLYDEHASFTKAYNEGQEDQRADAVNAITALASKIRLGLA